MLEAISNMTGPDFLLLYSTTIFLLLICYGLSLMASWAAEKDLYQNTGLGLSLFGINFTGIYKLCIAEQTGHSNVGFLIFFLMMGNLLVMLMSGARYKKGRVFKTRTSTGTGTSSSDSDTSFFFGIFDSGGGSGGGDGSGGDGGGSSCGGGGCGGCGGGGCGG